jgi:hypothetical protein
MEKVALEMENMAMTNAVLFDNIIRIMTHVLQ